MLVSRFLDIWPQHLGIDRIPPTVSALSNDVQVTGVDMSIVLRSVSSNCFTNLVLHFTSDCVFRGIHVRNLRPFQTLREFFPGFVRHVVRFANIQTPNLTGWLLEDPNQMQNLIIFHPVVEVLDFIR